MLALSYSPWMMMMSLGFSSGAMAVASWLRAEDGGEDLQAEVGGEQEGEGCGGEAEVCGVGFVVAAEEPVGEGDR